MSRKLIFLLFLFLNLSVLLKTLPEIAILTYNHFLMKIVFRTSFFSLLLFPVLFALLPQNALADEKVRFSHITMGNGLSSNSVFCLSQDYKGFMWLGTFSGLNRYDGNKFVVYKPENRPGSISSSVIFTIYEDSRKRLWIGTNGGGLNLYDREKNRFITYRHDPENPFSISSDQVYSIAEDKSGKMLVGTDGGGLDLMDEEGRFRPYCGNDGKEQPVLPEGSIIRVLHRDSSGRILVGTENSGFYVIDPDSCGAEAYLHDPADPASLPSNFVRTIFEDSSGQIWVGMENGGVAQFLPDKRLFLDLPLPAEGEDFPVSVRAITEDAERRLWIGTDRDGIYILDRKNNRWSIVKSSSGSGSLSSDTIRSFYTDINGHMWTGTRDGGVNLYNPLSSRFKFIEADSSLNSHGNQIREIMETPDRAIWIASDGDGLKKYDPETQEIKSFNRDSPGGEKLESNQCYSLSYDPEGFIWVGTDGGGVNIFSLKEERWIKSFRKGDNSGLGSDVAWDVFIDKKNVVWVGTEGGGLNRYNREENTFTSYRFNPEDNTSLNGNSVRDIYEDSRGRLWVGTWDGGLSLMDRERGTFLRFQFNPGTENGISDNSVNTILEDTKGRLWVGTSGGGLNLYVEGVNGEPGSFRVYREKDGLAGDNVMGIIEDRSGDMWITTNNGLSLFRPDENSFLTFGTEDGLFDNEFTRKAFCITKNGTIYVGSTRGINFFNPEDLKRYYYEPPILLTGFRIMNRDVPIGDDGRGKSILEKAITETESITLTQDEKVLSFTFSILDFIATHRTRYYTFLEGFDKDWNNNGNYGTVTFTSLPHGRYTLRARGENHIGQPLSGEISLEIRILPRIWQTWPFRGGSALLVLLGTYFTVRFKTRQLRRKNEQLRRFSEHIQNAREEERRIAAREVHDELGQVMTALKIDLFRFGKTVDREKREQTDSMLTLVNNALDSIKALSTNLRPKALDTLSLEEALQWQTVEFQRRTNIECRFSKENLEEDFDSGVSTAVFRIYQEILTNIIRHSGADHVVVDIRNSEGMIILSVSDNGCGIPPEKLKDPDSFGLMGMRERCRIFGGKLRVETGEGRGTTVTAEIPAAYSSENRERME